MVKKSKESLIAWTLNAAINITYTVYIYYITQFIINDTRDNLGDHTLLIPRSVPITYIANSLD